MAIMASLYIVDKKYLLGLIDKRAYDRMNNNKAIKTDESQPNIQDTMQELTKTAKNIYDLIDKVYNDILVNNGNY